MWVSSKVRILSIIVLISAQACSCPLLTFAIHLPAQENSIKQRLENGKRKSMAPMEGASTAKTRDDFLQIAFGAANN